MEAITTEAERGLLKPVAPFFVHGYFSRLIKGVRNLSARKKRDCSTNPHKPGQTSTIFVPREGRSSLAPVLCFLLQSAASGHLRGGA